MTFNCGSACEFTESRSLERGRDSIAVIIQCKVNETVILPTIDPAVSLLTAYII